VTRYTRVQRPEGTFQSARAACESVRIDWPVLLDCVFPCMLFFIFLESPVLSMLVGLWPLGVATIGASLYEVFRSWVETIDRWNSRRLANADRESVRGAFWLGSLSALHIQPRSTPHLYPSMRDACRVRYSAFWGALLCYGPRLSVDNPGGVQQVAEMLITIPLGSES